MKVIDLAAKKGGSKLLGVTGRALGKFDSPTGRAEAQAEDRVAEILGKMLDKRYMLLRRLPAAEGGPSLPLVLVGPPGIWVITVSAARGVFRATEMQWEEMDEKARGFKPAKTNLLSLAAERSQAVVSILTGKEIEAPAVEPAVIFAHPGAHVESTRPAVRVVMVDAIERYVVSIAQSRPVLDDERIQAIADALSGADQEQAQEGVEPAEIHDRFSFHEKAPPKPKKKLVVPEQLSTMGEEEPEVVKRLSKRFSFTRRQWLILGLLLLVCLLVLAALIVVIAISA
jgi:hypothetical protein